MAVNIDTQKIRNCGNDILKLVEDLRGTYTSMFNELSNVSNSRVWIGDNADKFISSLAQDKLEFMNYVNSLSKYGNYLLDTATQYEKTIDGVRR